MVTDDLTLDDGGNGTDVVGLIAGDYVWVYHPLDRNGKNLPGRDRGEGASRPGSCSLDPTASSYRTGRRANRWASCSVLGTIGQKLRGPVGAHRPGHRPELAGYLKHYELRPAVHGHPAPVLPEAGREPVAGPDGHR